MSEAEEINYTLRRRDPASYEVCPDYAHDLNAQQRVIENLKPAEWSHFKRALRDRAHGTDNFIRTLLTIKPAERASMLEAAIEWGERI